MWVNGDDHLLTVTDVGGVRVLRREAKTYLRAAPRAMAPATTVIARRRGISILFAALARSCPSVIAASSARSSNDLTGPPEPRETSVDGQNVERVDCFVRLETVGSRGVIDSDSFIPHLSRADHRTMEFLNDLRLRVYEDSTPGQLIELLCTHLRLVG